MAFMGYETPVAMPSMGVYNTDLMKMYIAGVKDQYEKGQEEMKDFMKLYQDFYSDIPGATEEYNRLTLGGARDMINQMMAAGIDPYKSPEARAAISRYIASRPTGLLNNMKLWAENAKEYKKNRDKLIMAGQFDPEFEKFMLGGELESWDPTKPFTATTPYTKQDWEQFATPYFKNFKAQEDLGPSRPGYRLYGTKPEEIEKATNATYDDLQNSPWGRYQIDKAWKQANNMVDTNGLPLTDEQKTQAVEQILRRHIQDAATHYFQPEEKDDKLAQNKIMENLRTANDNWLDAQKTERDFQNWKRKEEYNPNSPLYKFGDDNSKPINSKKTGKQYASWWEMVTDQQFVDTKGSHLTFLNGQKYKVHNAFKNADGTIEASDKNIDRAINAMSQTVPSYTLQVLLSRTPNKDGSVNISRADINRIYHKNHIAQRMAGSPMRYKDKDGKIINQELTDEVRKKLQKAIGAKNADMSGSDRIKGATMAAKNKIVYYVSKDGRVRVFMPVSIVTDRNTTGFNSNGNNDDLMFDTGISGYINKDGEFVAQNEQYLNTFDKDMTHKFANKSDYSVPINPQESTVPTYPWGSGEDAEFVYE